MLALLKLFANFENPSSNPLQRTESGYFDTENAHRSRLWFCKTIPEAACDKLFVAHFPCSQWWAGIREHQPITEKGILRRVSVSIFKVVNSFKEANKKFIIVHMVVKNIWKILKTISLYTESTAEIYRPSQKYPYRGSVLVAVEDVLLFIWGLAEVLLLVQIIKFWTSVTDPSFSLCLHYI